MAIPAKTVTLAVNTLFATTWEKRVEAGITMDNVSKITPLTALVHRLGQAGNDDVPGGPSPEVKPWSGGRNIVFPVELDLNESVQSIARGAAVTLVDSDPARTGEEDWRDVTGHVLRFRNDIWDNVGAARIMDLVALKVRNLEKAFAQNFETRSFVGQVAAEDPLGLPDIIMSAVTTGTVHGLDQATFESWRNQITACAAAGFAIEGRRDMNALHMLCQTYFGRINLIMTSPTVFRYVYEEADEYKVIQNKQIATLNFQSVSPWPGCDVMWSPSMTAAAMFFIDTRYLWWAQHPSAKFVLDDWMGIPYQPFDKVAHAVNRGNWIAPKRNGLGYYYDITA